MPKIKFIGESYTSRSPSVSAQRTVNLYPEVDASGNSKSVVSLHGRPGLSLFSYITTLPMRGIYAASNGTLYGVAGGKIYSIDSAGVETELGTLVTSAGRVSFADNGTELMVVDGTSGYIVTMSSGSFAEIADEDFTGADVVDFLDGYFICNNPATGQFYISGLYDGTAWDALDIATAESAPDDLVSLINDHRELWLFGDYSTEVWVNTGNSSFPFERMNGAVIEKGIAARWSVAKLDNSVFWLAKDKTGQGVVVRANGYTPQVISTRAIENEIAGYSAIDDAWAFTCTLNGHVFYVLTFPTGDATWVYDVTTGMWHEWSSRNAIGEFKRYIGNTYAFCYGKHLVGDFEDGDIYEMDSDVYTDNGEPIVRTRRAQHLSSDMKNLFMSRLQIDMEMGVGDNNYTSDTYTASLADGSEIADGSVLAGGEFIPGGSVNPQAMLRWSDDGGRTFGNEHWVTLGKQGEYRKRAVFRRLGRSRNRVFELVITDPIKVTIIDAYADINGGRH